MRTPFALTLVLAAAGALAACGPADRPGQSAAHDAPSASQFRGPDPLVLRVPRAGGRARVHAYPRVDSVVWSAPGAPRIRQVLGFDAEEGVIAFVDQANVPGRIDLRLGEVSRAGSRFTVTMPRTADGSSIFGIAGGNVVRYTTTGRWELDLASPLATVFPQGDGSIIAMSVIEAGTADLWRVFPPNTDLLDSVRVTGLAPDGPRLQGGDRLYLATDSGFAVVQARDLAPVAPVALGGAPRDAAATPSGDRIFIAVTGDTALAVYERYTGRLGAGAPLPAESRAVRMDPLGRYLLVRPMEGDSAWVLAVGTSKLIGTVRTAWRADLPFVGPDGVIATAQGDDVAFVDGATLRETRRVKGGAADYWYPFQWNGFRPRAAGLDNPVEFEVGTSDSAADSALAAAAAAADSAHRAAPATAAPQPAREQWVVSFAALLVESSAQRQAEEITVDGRRARVVTTLRDGIPVYRVIVGPYPSREEAERVGRASGRPYWVYAAGG